jgi:hypothetical protein
MLARSRLGLVSAARHDAAFALTRVLNSTNKIGLLMRALMTVLTLAAGSILLAQAPPDPNAPAAPEAPPPTAYTYKGFNFSGYLDTFYINNGNNPASGVSQNQVFTFTSDKWSLNSITGSVSYDPKPIGFRVDVGNGRTYEAFYLSEPKHTQWSRYLLNAYASVKPAAWKGVQIDFGKFTTSAGAEVTETHLNWNYSRSLLFFFAPFYHTGVRVTAPVKSNWTLGFQGVTGWNVMRDNNTGKTYGFTSLNTLAGSKVTIANNYYTGPENTGTNKGWRNFYDLAVTVTPTPKLSAYVNYDVGNNKFPGGASASFWGIGGAARYEFNKYFAVSPRVEHYRDSGGMWYGTPLSLGAFTLTGEIKINPSIIWKAEYRRDWADQPFFMKNTAALPIKDQNIFLVGFTFVVKPGMLKFN